MVIKTVPSTDIYKISGEYIKDQIVPIITSGKKVFLQASGGSAIKSLQSLAEWMNKFHERLDDSLVISLIDERYNSHIYDAGSNTVQINELIKVHVDDLHEIGLIDLMENSGGHKGIYERINHGLPKDNEVKEFEALLHRYLNDSSYVKIAIYGIGDDSHISGILPYPDDRIFFESNFNSVNLATGYIVKDDRNPYKDRITTTLTAMRKVDQAIVIISGPVKQKALQNALDNSIDDIYKTPATVLKQLQDVIIFTDLPINLSES